MRWRCARSRSLHRGHLSKCLSLAGERRPCPQVIGSSREQRAWGPVLEAEASREPEKAAPSASQASWLLRGGSLVAETRASLVPLPASSGTPACKGEAQVLPVSLGGRWGRRPRPPGCGRHTPEKGLVSVKTGIFSGLHWAVFPRNRGRRRGRVQCPPDSALPAAVYLAARPVPNLPLGRARPRPTCGFAKDF